VAVAPPCPSCATLRVALDAADARITAALAESARLHEQLDEALKLVELQRGDLDRYRAAYERVRPNTPERVPTPQLQLAFERVLASLSDLPAAQTLASAAANEDAHSAQTQRTAARKQTRKRGGRRPLDLTNLPVEKVIIDPDDVLAAGGDGFDLVGTETSSRVAFKPASYVRIEIQRRIWARKRLPRDTPVPALTRPGHDVEAHPRMVVAPLPGSLWPMFMADPSAIAAVIVSKYDDSLPLHRQERITARSGWRVPRSTQCGWLGEAYRVLYRIVDAMHAEAVARAFCLATDATGARVRIVGGSDHWHVFVIIADRDHVLFRHTAENTSEAIHKMFRGFRGHLLADAAPVFDVLHRDGAIEVGCWFHLRRYFWRALTTDPQRALEVLALIAQLFKIERDCKTLPLPQHTAERARRSAPVLAVLDEWIERNRTAADPRGPLHQGIGYYLNQRLALRRFLEDGRLRLDNSISEQQLRNLVLGRHNWVSFANETGVKWYTTFRSLIASCNLHGINPHQYLEQVLRLAPHWPISRVLQLAPKYWTATVADLQPDQRRILVPPWEQDWRRVDATAPPRQDTHRQSA
jgi:transposase